MKKLFLFPLFACLFGCKTASTHYLLRINNVEGYGGRNSIESPFKESLTNHQFSDDRVNVEFSFIDKSKIFLKITNLSSSSIKVLWDDCAFVDHNGSTSRVIHQGVRFMEKEAPQPPTVIAKGAHITDLLLPVNNISYNKDWIKWEIKPIMPMTKSASEEMIGKSVVVILSFEIEGKKEEYLFSFGIDGVSGKIKNTDKSFESIYN